MKTMCYKVFYSEEDFVKWQMQEQKDLYSVVPILLEMNSNVVDGNKSSEQANYGCFVTYAYDVEA